MQTTTSTWILCNPPATVASPDSCTLFVSNDDWSYHIPPTGTVTFSGAPGGFPTSPLSLSSGGCSPSTTYVKCVFSFTPSSGSEGVYSSPTASYSGDTTHGASSSTTKLIVRTSTTVAFGCASASLPYTRSTQCTVTVTNIDPGYLTPPSGLIIIYGGPGDFPFTCTLVGSIASSSCALTYNSKGGSEGVYSIKALFISLDGTHASSGPSPAQSLTIYTPTVTSLSCSPGATAGSPESCTVTVTNVDHSYHSSPSGTVTLGGKLPPGMPISCKLTGGGGISSSCTVSWTPATQGTYSISASYGGDVTHQPSSTIAPITLVIAVKKH